MLWHVRATGWALRPAVDSAAVYFATTNHEIVAIDRKNGAIRWRRTTGAAGSQTNGFNVLRVGSVVILGDRDLYAYDALTGTPRWTFSPANGDQPGYGLLATNGALVFAGTPEGRVYAVDAASGAQRWSAQMPRGDPERETAAYDPVFSSGRLFVGVKRFGIPATGALVALDANSGRELWTTEFEPSEPGQFSGCFGAAALHGSLVIVGVEDGRVVALDQMTGEERYTLPRVHQLPPEGPYNDQRSVGIVSDVLVATSTTGRVIGVAAATGAPRWNVVASPTAVADPFTSSDSSAFVSHGTTLVVYSGATGVVRWRSDRQQSPLRSLLPSPTHSNDTVFVAGTEGFFALTGL